jgi:NitT/TauT family transport system permease protein
VELPSALPYILSGMEVGIVFTTTGAVVGEFLGGNVGLGHLAVVTLTELRVERLFGVILLLTILGFLLSFAVGLLHRLAIPWHESQIAKM